MSHHHNEKKAKQDNDGPRSIPVTGPDGKAAQKNEPLKQEELVEAGPAQEQAEFDQELAKVKAERYDYLARLQRVSADFVNYQKRAVREAIESRETANAELIKNLLGVLDDMERALEAAKAAGLSQDDALLKGMELVHAKALETLSRYGLAVIEAQGQPFDPQKHQAVMQMASGDVPPGSVIKELQKGYTLRGKVLRPSTVVVSKAPDEASQQ